MQSNQIIVSYPTYGPSGNYIPAATYRFMTAGYKPPRQNRSISTDTVHNANGVHKYIYDNGPRDYSWDPFEVALEDVFGPMGGSATQQLANLKDIWNHVGPLSMQTPDGLYDVHWAAGQALEPKFVHFPNQVGDKIEYRVTVQFEEA
jgi:hypothetical protein